LEKTKQIRNCSIDIFRYICAILVIAIHTHPFEDIHAELGYIFTEIVPSIAVPFFFAVAGYFYINKLISGKPVFVSYIKRLLQVYVIWSAFYFVFLFVKDVVKDGESLFEFIKKCIFSFFITGSYTHLWFFPALIFSVCFVTILYKAGGIKILIPISIILYVIGCFGCSYYTFGVRIPVLGNLFVSSNFTVIRRIFLMGFPFFTCGYFVSILEKRLQKSSRIRIGLICSILIFIGEIYLVRKFGLQVNIAVTFGLYILICFILLLLLQNPMPQLEHISSRCKTAANFTYYSHPFFIFVISLVSLKICRIALTQTPLFILTFLVTLILGLCIDKINNKYLNLLVH